MRKITLILLLFLSWCGYSQLAEEGFEAPWLSTGPVGWQVYQNEIGLGQKWRQTLNNSFEEAYDGDHAAVIFESDVPNSGDGAKDWLVTPAFNLPDNAKLKFYSKLSFNGDQGGIYRVYIIPADLDPAVLTNYNLVQEWDELELNPNQTEYAGKELTVFPDGFIGTQVRLAFYMEGDAQDRWFIDNVSVVEQCLAPSNLSTGTIAIDSAELTWDFTSEPLEWEIEVLPIGDVPTGSGDIYDGTLPYEAGGLEGGTDYKFLVRAICDVGPSDWVGPFTFTTNDYGDTCNEPIAFNTIPYYDAGNTADHGNNYDGSAGESGCGVLSWQEYLNGNDVVYAYTAGFTGEVNIDFTNAANTSGIFIYDSCDNIGVNCIGGAVTDWEGTSASIPSFAVTFGQTYYIVISSMFDTTPYNLTIQEVSCEQPEGLPVTGIDLDSALLSWTNPTDADAWEIVVQELGEGLPMGSGEATDTNTNFLADGLEAATQYEFYIRSDCGDGTFSAWAGPYPFTTSLCLASEQCQYTFLLSDTGDDGWSENTMTVSQNGVPIAILGPQIEYGGGVPIPVTVDVCTGVPVELYWNEGGFVENQVGIAIKNSFGQLIYSKPAGIGDQDSLLFSGIANCDGVTCFSPIVLTALNPVMDGIQLGWDGPSTGNWEYFITELGEPGPTNLTVGEEATTNPVLVSGLDPATNYVYYVRMVCETGFSDWSLAHPFSTSVCPEENTCDYTFLMTGTEGSTPGYFGNTFTISQNGANVAVIGNEFVSGESMEVTISLCEGLPFDVLWSTGTTSGIGLEIISPFNQTLYELNPGGSTSPGNIVYTGPIVDCDNPACVPPIDLTAANPITTTIDLGWQGMPEGSWEYYITEAGNPAPTADTEGEPTSINPVTADELTASTNYEYYVRVICQGDTESDWAGPFAFSTTVCNPVDQCVYIFEMTSELGWGWEGNTMSVSQGGVPVAVIGGDVNPVEIPLCPDIPIEIFWNEEGWGSPNDKGLIIYTPYLETYFEKPAGTGSQGTVIFSGTPTCDVPACPKPQDLEATDITATSAVLGWTEMGSADAWEIWVLPTSAPAPTTPGIPVTEDSYLAGDLNSGTAYVFYVRANCDGNGFSTWSGPFIFATPLNNDDCINAIPLTVNSGIECIDFESGLINGSTSSGIQSACAWAVPNYDVWYSFIATNEWHNINISSQTGETLPMHAVYKGGCDGLTEVSCGWEANASVLWDLVPGDTYWVQVYLDPGAPDPSSIISFDICVYTPVGASLLIDKDEYSVEEIVNDILIDTNCGSVSNITSSTGINYDIPSNGIAYFNKGITNFPLQEGIVLTSTDAGQVRGPNVTTMGNGAIGGEIDYWPGDDQLLDYLQSQGLPSISTLQASILEFDFVPVTNKIKFPFIFASEEYNGSDQCYRSDAFAFFLTHPDGSITNLAVVPGTTVPVSSISIRDAAHLDPNFEFTCDSQNEEYFGDYYGPFNGLDPMTSPTNFNGHTVLMYAQADVVPGQTYHIKLVVADEYTSGLDSAVFIGPFDIGNVDIGVDLTVEEGSALCYGEEFTIESGLDPAEYTFAWSHNGEVMEGETGPDLVVSEAGEYTIEALYLETTCGGSDTVVIEYHPSVADITGDPIDLITCDQDGIAQFDMSGNTTLILGTLPAADYAITYHLTDEDAATGDGAITDVYENETPFLQTLFVRIELNGTECYAVKEFDLIINDTAPLFELTEDVSVCDPQQVVLTVTPLDFNHEQAEYHWMFQGVEVGENIHELQGIGFGEYMVRVIVGSCEGTATVFISEDTDAVNLDITYGCEGNIYMINVAPKDGSFDIATAEISWSGPNGFNSSLASAEIIDEGTYTVTVTTEEGCTVDGSVLIEATQCLIPRGISPNGDGKNDNFNLAGFNVASLSIFNRYGKEVYHFEGDYTDEWHGQTESGEELPTGTYFYSVQFSNEESKTGWVYINRQEN